MMKSKVFIQKAIDIAKNYKTLYVMGCFGAPMTAGNKARYCSNHSYNKQAARTAMIKAASADTFGFDCVCLIKGILWGWCGDKSKTYGGAGYAINGVPDIGADTMITKCSGVSTTGWKDMTPGEAVWCSGHIGIYIGDGLAVECTPKWENKVQITAVGNIGKKSGYNTRTWTKHGKLPYVDYSDQTTTITPTTTKTVEEVAKEVIDGKWGNGDSRKSALTAAGYDYSAVQAKVNELLKGSSSTTTGKAAATTSADPKTIWDFLMGKIGNAYGVAGLMGNLYAESALNPCNLQNSYEKSLGYTDTSYTAAVDNGSYGNFVRDSAGYGLAQWTYWSRKEALKKYANSQNASIGNLSMQLGFLWKELSENYAGVVTTLKNAKSVLEASNAVLLKYERPANTGTSVQNARASYGEKYYKQYAGTSSSGTSTPAPATSSGKVTASKPAQSFLKSIAGTYTCTGNLNMRDGAGTSNKILVTLPKGTQVRNYGYYTTVSGVRWLYVQVTYKNVLYTGFCSSEWLSK